MTDSDLSKPAIRRIVVLWSSFLAASFGFMIMFAFVDPELLGQILSFPVQWSGHAGYAYGFLFLFLVSLVSSLLTMVLLKKRPKRAKKDKKL